MASETTWSPNMRNCTRCGIVYDWRSSSSSCLKMTYCNSLCERADLGFTIEGLIRTEFVTLPHDDLATEVESIDVAYARLTAAA